MTSESLISLSNTIFENKHFNASQLNISSRQINYWIANGLVPFHERIVPENNDYSSVQNKITEKGSEDEKAKWIRLDLTHAVWVSIVNELFKFRVPMEAMKQLTYQIWQKPRNDRYADNVLKHHIKNNPNHLSEEQIEKLKNCLNDELLMEYYLRTVITPFTDMVKSAVMKTKMPHTLLFIPETHDYTFHYGDQSLINDLGSVYIEKPMVSIPIAPIISKVLLADFDNKKRENLEYLNNVERQIRDIVVFKTPKFVEIAFQDEKIKPIIITEQHKTREQLADYIVRNKIKKGSKLLIDIRSNDNYKITLITTENT